MRLSNNRVGLALFAALTITACSKSETEQSNNPPSDESTGQMTSADTTAQTGTLDALLKDKRDAAAARATAEWTAVNDAQIASMEEARLLQNALNVGDTIPMFALPDANGDTVTARELLSDGPLVVAFYRGGWCPYCNIQLAYLEEYLPHFDSAGATLVAISPDIPDSAIKTVAEHNLTYPVLSDVGEKVSDQFGLRYKLVNGLDSTFKSRGLDLGARFGMANSELPLSATYVVDMDGVIRYAYLKLDYKYRAEPSEIVAVLNQL